MKKWYKLTEEQKKDFRVYEGEVILIDNDSGEIFWNAQEFFSKEELAQMDFWESLL